MKIENIIKKQLLKAVIAYNFNTSLINRIKVVILSAYLNSLYSKYGSNAKISVVYNRLNYIIALTDEHGNILFAMPDNSTKRSTKICYVFR